MKQDINWPLREENKARLCCSCVEEVPLERNEYSLIIGKKEGSIGYPEDLVDIGGSVLYQHLPESCAEINALV